MKIAKIRYNGNSGDIEIEGVELDDTELGNLIDLIESLQTGERIKHV